jgi:hypothetical protein
VTALLRGPRAAAAWAVEAVATAPAGLRSLVPGAPVPAALREDVLVAVARAEGADGVAWIHGEWRAFAGSTPDGDVRLALAAHAERCARAGHPVPPTELAEVLPPSVVRAVRAVVLGSPLVLTVGLRSGGRSATVRVGRGRAQVIDGLAPDVIVVLQGDVEPLVRLATGIVLREAHEVVARR